MTHDELVLNAALSRVNKSIARYISRVLDVDHGRTEYTRPLADVQRELADELGEAQKLLHVLIRTNEAASTVVIEGNAEPPARHGCAMP